MIGWVRKLFGFGPAEVPALPPHDEPNLDADDALPLVTTRSASGPYRAAASDNEAIARMAEQLAALRAEVGAFRAETAKALRAKNAITSLRSVDSELHHVIGEAEAALLASMNGNGELACADSTFHAERIISRLLARANIPLQYRRPIVIHVLSLWKAHSLEPNCLVPVRSPKKIEPGEAWPWTYAPPWRSRWIAFEVTQKIADAFSINDLRFASHRVLEPIGVLPPDAGEDRVGTSASLAGFVAPRGRKTSCASAKLLGRQMDANSPLSMNFVNESGEPMRFIGALWVTER